QPEGSSSYVAIGSWPTDLGTATAKEESFLPDSPLVGFLNHRRWIVDLRERASQPDLYDHIKLPSWIGDDRRWRLVSPIFLGDVLVGFFLLADPPEDFRLNYEDRDLLNTACQHVATLLALQDADHRVSELSQLEAYNRLTTFVMHDLKNCAAQLQLLVSNAARHRRNPDFVDDAFKTIAQTAARISRLITQLRQRDEGDEARLVELREALNTAMVRCASHRPRPTLDAVP